MHVRIMNLIYIFINYEFPFDILQLKRIIADAAWKLHLKFHLHSMCSTAFNSSRTYI